MSRKRNLQRLKGLSEIHSFNWKRRLRTSQAIDRGLRMPITQQHLQGNPQISRLSNSPGSVDANK